MYEQLAANKRKSWLLVLVFVFIVVAMAWAIDTALAGGYAIVAIAFVFAVATSAFSYWNSDRVALALSRAKPADPASHAQLINVVEGLSIAGGLPMPRVYVVDDPAPNAFATGRNPEHAAVAATTGLLEKFNRVELEGVMAHELSHIKNYDILVSTMAVVLVGMIALMSDIGLRIFGFGGGRRRDDNSGGPAALVFLVIALVLMILAPLSAQLMKAAISRRRESLADVSGVHLTRYPPGLISALEKLQQDETVVHSGSRATAHLWIEQPIARNKGEGSFSRLNRLFDTHPPLEERIRILRDL